MTESHYCTSDMERILAAQGSFICLPLSDKAAKTILADRSVGLWTWLAVVAAVGVLLIVLGCAARVVWGSYCPVLSPPYLYWLRLRLRLLNGGGSSGSGGQGGQGQDRNLELGARPRIMYETSNPGPTAPYRLHVPQPLGEGRSIGDIMVNSLVNENYNSSCRDADSIICPNCPNCYDSTATTQLSDSDSTVYAGLAAARTSTPLQAGCSKGSTRSLVSDAGSFKSVTNPDAQGAVGGAVGGAEATLVGSDPLLLYHPEHGVVVDRAGLEDNLMESIISGLVDSILGAFTVPVAAEVLDTMDTSTQTQSLDLSNRPLVAAEATPPRRGRPSLPRVAKTKTKGLYGDPSHPYRRYPK